LSHTPPGGEPTVAGPRIDGPGGHIGPYRLLRELGEGGFGVVYEAEQVQPVRRRVALKVIKLGMDTREVLARFDGERQALARMDHPHIAKVFGAGTSEDGRPYFVMELVKGESITDYCDARTLDVRARLALFVQVCEAVQHAHANGVIHRDLKPGNVLVATSDERPFAKVIDFGIAKATRGRLGDHSIYTQQGLLIGTPLYMSPEQVEGVADIDARTDVYALGVLLYELLTGTTPISADTLRQAGPVAIQGIVRDVVPPRPSARLAGSRHELALAATRCGMEPAALRRTLRGELDWIAMKALEKDRARRYDTAAALAGDVRRFLAGQPVLAGPPGFAYRTGTYLRRHRSTAAVGLVIAALALGLAFFAWRGRGAEPPPRGKSIAVLPFANLGTDRGDESFALGMHDEVLSDLARIADLRVISRASVMPYRGSTKPLRQVAAELGVAMVLDGTVQRVGQRVRLQVSLNDAATDSVVWSERFDTALTSADLVDIQARIARAVADKLGATVSVAEGRSLDAMPTRSLPAYQAFLRGKALSRYGEAGAAQLHESLAAFDEAVAADPAFAAAYAAQAVVHLSLFWAGEDRDAHIEAARLALDQATRIDPDGVDTLIALGYYHYWGFYDYDAAEKVLARAVELAPNNADAWSIRASNARRDLRFADAIAGFERCVELDPLRPATAVDLAYAIALAGDLARARTVAAHARAQAPHAPYVLGNYINLAILAGDNADAWRAARGFPTLDAGTYDHARTGLALYRGEPAALRALLATWPAPRTAPPYFMQFDLVRVFALRQLGERAAADALLAQVRAHADAALATDPLDTGNRIASVTAYGLAGDRERLRAGVADLLADPPKDKLWAAEEGFVVVLAAASAGADDAAFDLLGQVMDRAGPAQFARAAASPAFDALRHHPRYAALQARYEAARQARR
jgi:TolB-like protein/Tfp pilus assembly protein PilF